MNINRLIITGNLVADPTLRNTDSGTPGRRNPFPGKHNEPVSSCQTIYIAVPIVILKGLRLWVIHRPANL
jgi:single-stranded DNA-binding protein